MIKKKNDSSRDEFVGKEIKKKTTKNVKKHKNVKKFFFQ
jgi:hypothetical protein